jgi:hypothetical protein
MQSRLATVGLLLPLLLAAAHAKPAKEEGPAPSDRPAAAGVYIDAAGELHEWRVTPGHALLWKDQPYLPAGTLFRPASLHDTGPDAWSKDQQELDALRGAGVKDLLVEATRGLQASPEGALARLADALEERGFRYGLAFNDRPQTSIRGYWLQPSAIAVKAAEVAPGATSRWTVPVQTPGAELVLWALVDTENGAPIQAGRAPVVNGQAEISVSFRPARRIFPPGGGQLLVVPERVFAPGDETPPPPDLWAAIPGYRDGLLRALRGLRWGPGLRFILDPIQVDGALRGDIEELLPTSTACRIEFEAWLQQRGSAGDINIAWALNDRHLESLQVAARLVPLWHRQEAGSEHGWFLDPETLALYRANRRRTRFWRDLESFRVDSARRAMNNAADLLKERLAEVPILYRWTQLHPVFTNGETSGGWDGLVAPAAQPQPLAYAQCEASARALWCVAIGEDGEEAKSVSLPSLAESGIRGYFGEARGAAAPAFTSARPLVPSSPWGDEKALSESKPAVLFYPIRRMPGFGAARLANGVWWLPSYAPGRTLILGEGMEGYQIDLPFAADAAPTAVLWSTGGAQKATFVVPPELQVRVYNSLGAAMKTKVKEGRLRLDLTPLPQILGGLQGENVFPVEAATQALEELEALVRMAEARKINPNVLTAMKAVIADTQAIFTEKTAATAFDLIRGPLEMLRDLLSPYIWLEGERPRESRFSGVVPDPAASEGAYLFLSSTRDPAGGSYVARYTVNVSTSGLYELWIAGSAPGQEGASPLQWRIERQPTSGSGSEGPTVPQTEAEITPVTPPPTRPAAEGGPYAPGLSWTRLGVMRLEPGRYRLNLSVGERAGDRYLFRVDALLFAREPFRPDGSRKPTWRVKAK